MIDTHAHLCDPVFDGDREAVLERAHAAGVLGVLAVGETLADARRNLELSRRYPQLRMAAGLFPTVLDIDRARVVIDWIRRHREEVVAIGEVGLDYWKVEEGDGRALQRTIFGEFIDLAVELDLPLNVHSRSAGRATIDFLLEKGARRVQLHAFDGRAASALPGVEAGFFFSVPPSIVRSVQKQKLVRRLPLSSLLLETDSPVLGVEPSERNEPAQAVRSAQAIAELHGVDLGEVRRATLINTRRLYGPTWSAPAGDL